MTKISELKNNDLLNQKVSDAKKLIYKHLESTLGEDELQTYLFSLGIESLVKKGELNSDYLNKEYNNINDIDKELLNHTPSLTEIGYNAMINGFAVISYNNRLYGTFYYNSERDDESGLLDDINIFQDFVAGDDNAETIDVAILISDVDGNVDVVLV